MAGYKNPGWNNDAPPALNAENLNALCDEVEELSEGDDKVTLTLPAANWTGDASPYAQTVTIPVGTAASQVDLQASAEVLQQMLDDGTTALFVENTNGVFTVKAMGSKPTADLTIQATVYTVKEVSQ